LIPDCARPDPRLRAQTICSSESPGSPPGRSFYLIPAGTVDLQFISGFSFLQPLPSCSGKGWKKEQNTY